MARKRGEKGENEKSPEAMQTPRKTEHTRPIEWTKQADEVLLRLYKTHDRKRKLIREQIKTEHPEEFEFLAGLSSRRFDQEIGKRWRSISNKESSSKKGDSSSTEVNTPSEDEPVFVVEDLPTLERTDSVSDLV